MRINRRNIIVFSQWVMIVLSVLSLCGCFPTPKADDIYMLGASDHYETTNTVKQRSQSVKANSTPMSADNGSQKANAKASEEGVLSSAVQIKQGLPINKSSSLAKEADKPSSLAGKSSRSTITLTLTRAIALAIRYNLALKSAKLNRIIEKYQLLTAEYNFVPQFSLSGNYNYDSIGNSQTASLTPGVSLNNHYGTTFSLSGGPSYSSTGSSLNNSATLSVSQKLLRGFGRNIVDISLKNAKDQEYINQLNFMGTVSSTITTVISNYFSLIQAYQTLSINKATLKRNQQLLKRTQIEIKAGRIAKSSLIDIEANIASTKASIASQENSIANLKRQFLNSIGLQGDTPIILPKLDQELQYDIKILTSPLMFDKKKSFNYALQHNISYQGTKMAITTAERSLVSAKNAQLPELDLTASHSFDLSGDSGTGNGNSIQLNYQQPINDLGLKEQLVAANIGLKNAHISLEQAKRTLYNTISNNVDQIDNLQQQYKLAKQAQDLQLKNYDIAKTKYIHGLISNYDLNTVNEALSNSQTALIDNRISYLNALATFATELNITLQLWHIKIMWQMPYLRDKISTTNTG